MKYKLIMISLMLGRVLYAQTPLSLNDAINLARANNNALQINILEVETAKADVDKMKSAHLPQVDLSYSILNTNDPLNAFAFKLQQEDIGQADFNPALLNNPDIRFNFNTKLAVKQPILNFDVLSMKKALLSRVDAMELKSERIKDAMELEVQKTYLNLQYLYAVKDVLEGGLKAYTEAERVSGNFLIQGMIQKYDMLSVSIERKNIVKQMINIDNNIKSLSTFLDYLMAKQNDVSIYFPSDKLSLLTSPIVSNEISNRADILAMNKGIEAKKWMMDAEKAKRKPRINAFGEFNFHDKSPKSIGANGYTVGIQASINLFDGHSTKYELAKNKLEVEKMEKQIEDIKDKSKIEIIQLQGDLQTKLAEIDLTNDMVDQANESQKIRRNRYAQGLEKTVDILSGEAKILEKQLQHTEAIKNYNLNVYQLIFNTKSNN